MTADLYCNIQVRLFELLEAGFIGGLAYESILEVVEEEIDKQDSDVQKPKPQHTFGGGYEK